MLHGYLGRQLDVQIAHYLLAAKERLWRPHGRRWREGCYGRDGPQLARLRRDAPLAQVHRLDQPPGALRVAALAGDGDHGAAPGGGWGVGIVELRQTDHPESADEWRWSRRAGGRAGDVARGVPIAVVRLQIRQ